MPKRYAVLAIALLATIFEARSAFTQTAPSPARQAMFEQYQKIGSSAFYPNWLATGNRFWWLGGPSSNLAIFKLHPEAKTKETVIDTVALRQILAKAIGNTDDQSRLGSLHLEANEKVVTFSLGMDRYKLQLDNHELTLLKPVRPPRQFPDSFPRSLGFDPWRTKLIREAPSPDGRWLATLKNHNVWLRSATTDGLEVELTTDGAEDNGYTHWWNSNFATWSPDSRKLVVTRVDYRALPKVPFVDWLAPSKDIEWATNQAVDVPPARVELFAIDLTSRRQTRIDLGSEPGQWFRIVPSSWKPDSQEFLLTRINHAANTGQVLAINPETGATRVLVTETAKRLPNRRSDKFLVQHLFSDSQRFILRSFRDGWPNLYLYDVKGNLIRGLTQGVQNVIEVQEVDESAGWVYFTAHGDSDRPYDTHFYRVDLEGKRLTRLTEGTGQHLVEMSPSRDFFLDTHSSITRPPTVELRKSDGSLVLTLAGNKSKIKSLKQMKWIPPEEFVVKAADGRTDLHGVLYKPWDFDPAKRYPVIESIYPMGNPFVGHGFYSGRNQSSVEMHALAQLGFIVFAVDARGTKERDREFYESGLDYSQLIPDHVAALTQLGATRPYMDLTRVGIFGHSDGGYAVVRALLRAPNNYHVGVAFAPAIDKMWGIQSIAALGLYEQNKAKYENASVIRFAGNLSGRLLMVQGTNDRLVPFHEIMSMLDAFARAGKPYDLIVIPQDSHGLSKYRQYVSLARRNYFLEHLKPVPFVEISPIQTPVVHSRPVVLGAKAHASAESRVMKVEFLVDEVSVGIDPEPPYQTSWSPTRSGPHAISAIVSDSSGRTERSSPVTINIDF